MPRGKRDEDEPRTVTGMCWGKRCAKKRYKGDVPLFRVSPMRYRCRECYKLETGYYP